MLLNFQMSVENWIQSKKELMKSISSTSSSTKRGLLRRSKALTMENAGQKSKHRKCLQSWAELDRSDTEEESDDVTVFPSVTTGLLDTIGSLGNKQYNKNLNDSEIEDRFARLSLAFRTDTLTLNKRLDLQVRQRDISEKNIDFELKALRESLNALNQLCSDSEMREVITKTQQHVDIVQQATVRMSSRAETYGAIQQEKRMNCAFETMLNYVEHLKLIFDKEHIELEEYRRLLAEHNLLPDEKGSPESGDDTKRNLPPRSHSLSSPSKPESRTRLLSTVCLLNNNYESSRPGSGSTSASNVSLSPKSRRSSLPVGPISNYSETHFRGPMPTINNRSHGSINEHEVKKDVKEKEQETAEKGRKLSRTEQVSEKQKDEHPPTSNIETLEIHVEDTASEKDSSRILTIPKPYLSQIKREDSTFTCSVDSTCDNETDDDASLLPEILIPVVSKPLYIFKVLQWASEQGIWHWDNATLLLNARYTLSAMLATAAMCSLVLTFMPNLVTAYITSDASKRT